jgi:hypothetical protein
LGSAGRVLAQSRRAEVIGTFWHDLIASLKSSQ